MFYQHYQSTSKLDVNTTSSLRGVSDKLASSLYPYLNSCKCSYNNNNVHTYVHTVLVPYILCFQFLQTVFPKTYRLVSLLLHVCYLSHPHVFYCNALTKVSYFAVIIFSVCITTCSETISLVNQSCRSCKPKQNLIQDIVYRRVDKIFFLILQGSLSLVQLQELAGLPAVPK